MSTPDHPHFASLSRSAGNWAGRSRLQDPINNIADECDSTARVSMVGQGKFLRLDYTWAYHGQAQDGSVLIGHDPKSGEFSAHWFDSWHMGRKVMACTGKPVENGVSLLGSYPAPPGPDWGWRIDVLTIAGSELQIVMYNITPDGIEELAVEGKYHRP